MNLYHYWRSSSSWRVRWAFALKKVELNYISVDLLNGENEAPAHLARHPLGYVPVLEHEGRFLIESVAIIEWLEEKYPDGYSFFPKNDLDRLHVRSLAEIINAGTQPLQNPSVAEFHSSEEAEKKKWMSHFIHKGLEVFEKLAKPHAGLFSFGDKVGFADFFLVPQCYNALRFGVDLGEFGLLESIYKNALATPEAFATSPDKLKPL